MGGNYRARSDAALRAMKQQQFQIADQVAEMKRMLRQAWVKLGVELAWYTAVVAVLFWVTA